jgi:hypothetical protein
MNCNNLNIELDEKYDEKTFIDINLSTNYKKLNILIIGYCRLDDGFLYASKALEKLNYNIYFFPYFNYILDKIDNKDNILQEFIIKNDINICLWWNNSIKSESIKNIIHNKLNNNDHCIEKAEIKHYLFNWDPFLYNYEKYNSVIWKDRIEERKKIYPLMEHVFSCFEKEVNYFKSYLKISYLPPGFDPSISYYYKDTDYECDVSIVCTNLYDNVEEFPDEATNITRFEIVNRLYENHDKIKFHIYGPENFKEKYPECYKGFISYKECYKVFSNSKINLSIHPMIHELNNTCSNKEYFSERVPQILGCKGLLMTNSNFSNILKKDIDYICIDSETGIDILDIIQYIINPVNKIESDRIRENGYKKAIEYYQWYNWANVINNIIQKDH